MQNVKRGRQRILRHELHLDEIVLQVGQRPLQKHMAHVHDADMVADVLQLAQIVRRYQHRRAVARHILESQTPDLPPHDGVKPVDRLVEHEIVRPQAQRQPEGRVLLHALGKAAQRRALVQTKDLAQRVKAGRVEARVHRAVKGRKLADRPAAEHAQIVRDIADAAFDLRVFIDRQTADGHAAGILTENACNMANGGGLSRAV